MWSGVLMESCSTRLLALSLALGLVSGDQIAGLAMAKAAPISEFRPEAGRAAARSSPEVKTEDGPVAWDCVPSYWWGYWTWAWQPCAWIDRSYVEGTIGAIAEARTTRADELQRSLPAAGLRRAESAGGASSGSTRSTMRSTHSFRPTPAPRPALRARRRQPHDRPGVSSIRRLVRSSKRKRHGYAGAAAPLELDFFERQQFALQGQRSTRQLARGTSRSSNSAWAIARSR